MRLRARAVIGCIALAVAISVAAHAFADLRAAATAMACCAKTNYECAGMRGPDDCCQQMAHVGSPVAAGTLTSANPLFVPTDASASGFFVQPISESDQVASAGLAFKRPHDPPHLHAYSLLI